MAVKSTVSFIDRHHQSAQDEAALDAMRQEIAQRLQTPRDEWIEMNDDDDVFDKAAAQLKIPINSTT